MPAVVRDYIVKNTFEGSLDTQRQLITDYKEAGGFDPGGRFFCAVRL